MTRGCWWSIANTVTNNLDAAKLHHTMIRPVNIVPNVPLNKNNNLFQSWTLLTFSQYRISSIYFRFYSLPQRFHFHRRIKFIKQGKKILNCVLTIIHDHSNRENMKKIWNYPHWYGSITIKTCLTRHYIKKHMSAYKERTQ